MFLLRVQVLWYLTCRKRQARPSLPGKRGRSPPGRASLLPDYRTLRTQPGPSARIKSTRWYSWRGAQKQRDAGFRTMPAA